jgi:4-amino-4-deoxy-L-arabinose transferase-like glycosyltransferase
VQVALATVVLVGLVLRWLSAAQQGLNVDEPYSLLAATMILKDGIPLLPSGVLYLHGVPLSYLMAPLLALGVADIDNLFPMRLISVFAGTAVIYVTYLLAKWVFGRTWVAVGAALLVALDPISLIWSGRARMYALEQLFVALTVLIFVRVTAGGVNRLRHLGWLVVVFWLAVYSHLGAALLWPALVLVAVVQFGRNLISSQRDLLIALVACLLAPLSLMMLSSRVGRGAGTRPAGEGNILPGLSVLGDHKLDFSTLLNPSFGAWADSFQGGWFASLLPILIAGLSGVLVCGWLMPSGRTPGHLASGEVLYAPRVGALLALYWVPVAIFASISTTAVESYFIFLSPLGCALFAGSIGLLWMGRWSVSGAHPVAWSASVVAIALLLLGQSLLAILTFFTEWAPRGDADLRPALESVAAERQPEDLVLASSSAVAYLKIADIRALRFLAGGEGTNRTDFYVRLDPLSGKPVDYWIGMPAIDSASSLCQTLTDNPGAWIVIERRWIGQHAFKGQMTDILEGAGKVIKVIDRPDRDASAPIIIRTKPVAEWSEKAVMACRDAGKPEPNRGSDEQRSARRPSDQRRDIL